MNDPVKFMHPLDHKVYEAAIAFYVFAVGCLFLFDAKALSAPVYMKWHELGPIFWGVGLVITSFLHVAALRLNGKNLKISQPVRLLAIFMHLGISLQFAQMFFATGAVWGTITYGLFVPILLILIGRNVMRYYLRENDNANSF